MKVKQNLLGGQSTVYTGRFYYGVAPRGAYSCKGCEKRHVGCHADCPEYNAEKADDDIRIKEELKKTVSPMSSAMKRNIFRKQLEDRRK